LLFGRKKFDDVYRAFRGFVKRDKKKGEKIRCVAEVEKKKRDMNKKKWSRLFFAYRCLW